MSQLHDLYYFLYPPPLVAESAQELLPRAQGRRWPGRGDPMSSDRLHITLHALGRFLNGVPREVIDFALAAGVVTAADRRSGYGNTVEISHADGYVTLYAHNQSNLVQIGDLVQRGQTIARVGRSGRASGYHVHFEVSKKGRLVNPASYIARVSDVE